MFTSTTKRTIAILTAVLLMLALSATALAERLTVYTANDGAKVYDEGGNAVGTLPADIQLTLTGVKGDICRVEKGGRTAYMMKSDLSRTPSGADAAPEESAEPARSVKAYVTEDGAAVYTAKGVAAATLPLNTAVTVTGVKGSICRVEKDGRTGYMRKGDLGTSPVSEPAPEPVSATPSNGSTVTPARGTAKEMDWWTSDIQTIFARGVVAQITDVETGLSWREVRNGGTNHADCQPLTAADTAVMKRVYGGTWSWNRRAVFVTIDGVNYAASINGMPHGSDSIPDNDFDGHHCIHFTNSRTHGSNKLCPLHQAAVKKAAEARL